MSKIASLYQGIKKHAGKIMAGSALVGLTTFGPPLYVVGQDSLRGDQIRQEISELETKLSDSYEIDVAVWNPPPGGFDRPQRPIKQSLEAHSPYMALKALEGLEDALNFYPPQLVEDNLRMIEIVRGYLSGSEESRRQGATPVAFMDFTSRMSISAGRDDLLRYHKAVLGYLFESESLHHELAHSMTEDIPEQEWQKLHPDAVYDRTSWRGKDSLPQGFFNEYATHSILEDMASTVELLYDADYDEIVAGDEILKNKAEFLKEWYFEVSDGVINEEYWSTVQEGMIPVFVNQ